MTLFVGSRWKISAGAVKADKKFGDERERTRKGRGKYPKEENGNVYNEKHKNDVASRHFSQQKS